MLSDSSTHMPAPFIPTDQHPEIKSPFHLPLTAQKRCIAMSRNASVADLLREGQCVRWKTPWRSTIGESELWGTLQPLRDAPEMRLIIPRDSHLSLWDGYYKRELNNNNDERDP